MQLAIIRQARFSMVSPKREFALSRLVFFMLKQSPTSAPSRLDGGERSVDSHHIYGCLWSINLLGSTSPRLLNCGVSLPNRQLLSCTDESWKDMAEMSPKMETTHIVTRKGGGEKVVEEKHHRPLQILKSYYFTEKTDAGGQSRTKQ